MAEWTDVRIEDELRAVLRREADSLPVTVTRQDVLARARAPRHRTRRTWLTLAAAALLLVPIALAAGIALAPRTQPTYLAVLARGLSTTDFRTPNEHVPDLELVLVHPDGAETPVVTIPASRFDGWKTTRRYALSPDGRWLAMTLQVEHSDDIRPEAPPLAVIDLQDPSDVRLVSGGRLEPSWAADGTLWWRVGGRPQRIDLEAGDLVPSTDATQPQATRPPAIASHLDEIDGSGRWPFEAGDWDIVSVAHAADGGEWLLIRREPDRSFEYRLVHRDPDGTDRASPGFEGHGSYGLAYDALVMAPDDSLAAVRDHDYKRASTGEVMPGRTQILDVSTNRAGIHTGWLVGFVRSDAAAEWAHTAGGSR